MYAEETDWCRRLADAGWRRMFVPEVGRIHRYGNIPERTMLYIEIKLSSIE